LVRIRLSLSDAGADRLERGVAWLAYRAIPSRRKIATRNLQRALGQEKTPQELTQLLREAYQHSVAMFSDLLPLFKEERNQFLSRIRIEGLEHLKAAQAPGRGVIGVSAHYGGFPMLGVALSSQGVPVHFLYRRPKSPKTARLFDDWLARAGYRIIEDTPRHLSVLHALKALSEGALICILIDQHFAAGVQVPFFGQPSKTGVGAAFLAVHSQAPLVPMVLRRLAGRRYQLTIEPALAPPKDHSRESLTACMAELTRRVEGWIREKPSQWFWVHRRWKDLDNSGEGTYLKY